MTLSEARQILGLGPDEDPRPHMREFRIVRERLAEMVRDAPTDTLAERYQLALMDMDRALAAVREYLQALGLEPPEVTDSAAIPPAASRLEPVSDSEPDQGAGPARRRGRLSGRLAAACLLILTLAGGAWCYLKWQADERYERQLRIARLEGEGADHIRERRWEEAKSAFEQIERIDPASPTVALGRRGIEAGMAEEQEMFVNYWTGQARAAIDSARFDEAEEAARKVLAGIPKHSECLDLLKEISAARASADRTALLERAKDHLAKREWDRAAACAREMASRNRGDEAATAIIEEAEAAISKAAADQDRARALYQQAVAKDNGEYDAEVFEWLREATMLAPEDALITALFEKVSSRSRPLRVPEAFPTPQEALARARQGDRIILGEGLWKGPLEVNVPVEILGAGTGKTVIGCEGAEGCVITLGPGAAGSRVSRVTLRHHSLTGGTERFSAALVRGAAVEWTDCEFLDACGHGLALIEQARSKVARCRFAGNGWNGAAANGPGSTLEIRDSSLNGNFNHGLEAWNDAALTAVNNRCEGNTGNGIHIDTGEAPVVITGNQLAANREFGIVITSTGATGQVRQNTAKGNLLGGMAIRSMALCPVTQNKLDRNQGPGLALEDGLSPIAYTSNSASGNTGKDLLTGLKFPREEEPGEPGKTAAR